MIGAIHIGHVVAHDHFMCAQVPVVRPVHDHFAQGVQVHARARLIDARERRVAAQFGIEWLCGIGGRATEHGVPRRGEVHGQGPELQPVVGDRRGPGIIGHAHEHRRSPGGRCGTTVEGDRGGGLEPDGRVVGGGEALRGGRGVASQHLGAVQRIDRTTGPFVACHHVHAVPHTVLRIVRKVGCGETVRVPGAGRVGCLADRHQQAVAAGSELAHEPAVGNGIVQHDRITGAAHGADEVVQIDRRAQRGPVLVEHLEIGAGTAIDHLHHVVGSHVQAGVCRVHAGVTDAVLGQVERPVARRLLPEVLLPDRIGTIRPCLGVQLLMKPLVLQLLMGDQQASLRPNDRVGELLRSVPIPVCRGQPEEVHMDHLGIVQFNVFLFLGPDTRHGQQGQGQEGRAVAHHGFENVPQQ